MICKACGGEFVLHAEYDRANCLRDYCIKCLYANRFRLRDFVNNQTMKISEGEKA